MVDHDRLYHDADLARYYDAENGWRDDFSFCRDLAKGCRSLLDLGCGTGLFAAAMAGDDVRVVGVDPAPAMLDIARQRPGGGRVEWVMGDARSIRFREKFDLVVMTGHAFQVFLTHADRLAVLCTVAEHLTPKGRFVFDSRNPLREEWREWTPELSQRRFIHPEAGEVIGWNDVVRDDATGIVTYRTYYRRLSDGGIDTASSQLDFASRAEIADLLGKAGLSAETWLGDWRGAPWTAASPEIIPVGRLG